MNLNRTRARAGAALATGVTAALALSTLAAAPAFADPAFDVAPAAGTPGTPVTGAVFTWGLSAETGSKAFGPGFNFLSAGKVAKTSASDLVTQGEWLATSGNTAIQKKQADGSYAASTWAGLSTTAAGTPITTTGVSSENRVSISSGTGTKDTAADDADITWTGDFTVAFYSGLTQYSVSNPHLVLDGGTGSVTATLSGYGTDMADPTAFVTLPDTVVTLADLTGVDVTDTGFDMTPEYLGVSITAPENSSPQVTTGDDWGSFPQSFVDFQGLTGQSSYWYSSGGTADAGKVALPIGVTFASAPQVTVSKTTGLDPETDTVTVTGTGFVPSAPATSGTRPPLAGKFGGVYVAFGTFLDTWKPSAGAPSSARKTSSTQWAIDAADVASVGGAAAGAVAIGADGSFTVQLTVQKNFTGALANGNYGIYTYPGSGAAYAPFETYTPLSFALPDASRIDGADRYEVAATISQTSHPETSDTVYVANGAVFSDALSAAPAAASENAPLLLTPADRLVPAIEDEIERLAPTKIVVVGGPNSVSPAVFSSLEALAGESAVRIDGADRFEVSRKVIDYAFGESGATSAYVATGANFPDALSASAAGGSFGAPVLLVNGGAAEADAATKATLTGLGVATVKIAGGPASVSPGIEASLASVAPVSRLSGADRFEASISINKDAFTRASDVFIATGLTFPDALAGAALAASSTAPLYVVPSTCVPQSALTDIAALNPDRVTLLGGPNSLSAAVQSLTACAS